MLVSVQLAIRSNTITLKKKNRKLEKFERTKNTEKIEKLSGRRIETLKDWVEESKDWKNSHKPNLT